MLIADPIPARMPAWRILRGQGVTATDLLRAFRVTEPPIDVRAMALELGLNIQPLIGHESPGYTDSTETSAVVYINVANTQRRQRFTLAHEIGHLMLHPLGGRMHRDAGRVPGSSPQETEADAFAANLLMPYGLLHPYAMRYGANATALADMFEVSQQAMTIRLANMVGLK